MTRLFLNSYSLSGYWKPVCMSHRFTSENDGDQSSNKVAALSLIGERANQLQHIHNCFMLAQEHGHGFPRMPQSSTVICITSVWI